jgi:hypothetical protein
MAVEAVRKESESPTAAAEAVAAPAPKAPERVREVVVDLHTPARAHGESIKQMKFRRPTGGDLMQLVELPIRFDSNGNVAINPLVMGEMMALLAGVPPSTIKMMDSEDWSTCAYRLVVFFVPGM